MESPATDHRSAPNAQQAWPYRQAVGVIDPDERFEKLAARPATRGINGDDQVRVGSPDMPLEPLAPLSSEGVSEHYGTEPS